MKILNSNEERVIISLDDRRVLTVTNEGISLKYKVGNGHKTKNCGYDDMIAMNDLICRIMSDVIEERNKLKQEPVCIPNIFEDSFNNPMEYE